MSDQYLSFIGDDALIAAVGVVFNAIVKTKANVGIEKNSLDAFSALFECASHGTDLNGWISSEKARQAQKTVQNAIGTFHQRVIGSLPGCKDLAVGKLVDVVNEENNWVAEIKNKHNTVKGSDRKVVYDNLKKALARTRQNYNRDFCGYYVEIIPKDGKAYDDPFQPTDNTKSGKKRPLNKNIRIISGPLFYDKMTGEKDALRKLFDVVPRVLTEHFRLPCPVAPEGMNNLFRASFLGDQLTPLNYGCEHQSGSQA